MGASGSMLRGKAVVEDAALVLTSWDKDDVMGAFERFNGAGGNFALSHEAFSQVLNADPESVAALFNDVFDTDSNGLVDAYEVLASLAMASQMSNADRVDFVHSLYDFNGSGDLSKDEMTILMRTVVTGCAKLDKKVEEPPTEELEAMAERAFTNADKDSSGTITREEFDAYAYSAPRVKNFMEYWDGCLAQAKLGDDEMWEDPDFPCTGDALYKDEFHPPPGGIPASAIQWLRPDEFMDEPKLWVGGVAAGDVVQGALGDCWFLSALAVMAAKPVLLQKLFVSTGQEAQGRYCVKFFKDGDWKNVYVDDRIPCNRADEPVYCKSKDPNEFWPCLVEKAYAKLHGSYEALIGGYADYALADMTGGVPMVVRLDDRALKAKIADFSLWKDVKEWAQHGLMGAAHSIRKAGRGHKTEQEFSGGVLAGHAYSVLELVEAEDDDGMWRLIHIRNPWGMREWTGRFCDGDSNWDDHPAVAEACKYTGPVDDGCFWMCFEDFAKVYNTLYVVRLLEEADGWMVQRREAEWTEETAGGCVNQAQWVKNTQMALEIPADTEVVVSLMQPDARYNIWSGPKWNKYDNAIGLIVASHDWGSEDRVVKLTRMSRSNIKSFTAPFKPLRNMTVTVDLPAGKYIILPCTFTPGGLGPYWVSVYSKVPVKLLGGSEVHFDEAVDEEGEPAADLELKVDNKPKVDQEPQSNEDRAIMLLQKTIYEMAAMVTELQKRKKVLEDKVAALESS